MEGAKAVQVLLMSALILCWTRGAHSQPDNSTVCLSHPTGEVAFKVQRVPGPQGPVGEKGPPGGTGLMGLEGKVGPQGKVGVKGDVGAMGAQGEKGEEGQKGQEGDRGMQGATGPFGVQGVQGQRGQKGLSGLKGIIGPEGHPGLAGSRGRPGVMGPPGASGLQGLPGVQGPRGHDGDPGNTELTTEEFNRVVTMLQMNVLALHTDLLSDPCIRGMYPAIPASSCKEIHLCNPHRSSGHYWIDTLCGLRKVYCLMNTTRCGSVGGWMRVGQIDMTDPLETCPSSLRSITVPERMCIQRQRGAGCSSVHFPTHNVPYTHVCGQVIGYQFWSTDAFAYRPPSPKINSVYLDGISITYGEPRQHLWSYAVGRGQTVWYSSGSCPCVPGRGTQPPSFVNDDYYCNSGSVVTPISQWYVNETVWGDDEGCSSNSTCCNDPNMPWFHRNIAKSTTDDLEVRLCRDESAFNEDVGVELIELYTY